jgi:hypothetical protein
MLNCRAYSRRFSLRGEEMLRPGSSAGVAAFTVASVLACYGVVIGLAYVLRAGASKPAMALLFLFGAPLLPGSLACMVVLGFHDSACVPAGLAMNVVFYLAAVFIIRSRRARRARRADEATGSGGTN